MIFDDRFVQFPLHVVYDTQEPKCDRMPWIILQDFMVYFHGLVDFSEAS